jgi:feruloyl esterase
MIHQAVLNACDALDGVKDEVLEDPMKCKFDYATLLCKAGDSPDCLTKGQVESAKYMTSPLKDPKNGKTLFDRYLAMGSELGWATLGGPQPLGLSVSGLRNIVLAIAPGTIRRWNSLRTIQRATNSDKVMATKQSRYPSIP